MPKMNILSLVSILLVCHSITVIDAKPMPERDIFDVMHNVNLWAKYMNTWRKLHAQIPEEDYGLQEFNCTMTPPTTAANVHMLTAADIGVIAALGDSLTAANGAKAVSLPGVLNMYRGISFTIGADGDLEDTLTLPNLIKKYNPDLYGGSVFLGPAYDELLAHLNVAVPGSRASDLIDQANLLVKRILNKKENMNKWKVVTIFIGANDICACEGEKDLIKQWIDDIVAAVTILANGLTKTFVNIVSAPMVAELRVMEYYEGCVLMRQFECKCALSTWPEHNLIDDIIISYQRAIRLVPDQLALNRSDFTVVVQPFSENIFVPNITDSDTAPDLSYLAPDCFHFSRRGHAAAAMALWNNMFEKVGAKQNFINPETRKLVCPDESCPYFKTAENSMDCSSKYLLSLGA